jgi:hypothetical protein
MYFRLGGFFVEISKTFLQLQMRLNRAFSSSALGYVWLK